MKRIILLLLLLILNLCSANIIHNVQPENNTSVEKCTEHVINTLFGDETFYYVYNDNRKPLLPLTVPNLRIMINTKINNKAISGPYKVVVEMDDYQNFYKNMVFMLKNFNIAKKVPSTIVLVVTNQLEFVDSIFQTLWKLHLMFVAVYVIQDQQQPTWFTAEPFGPTHCLNKTIKQVHTCSNGIQTTIPKVVRNFYHCMTYSFWFTFQGRRVLTFLTLDTFSIKTETDLIYTNSKSVPVFILVAVYKHEVLKDHVATRHYATDTLVWIVPRPDPIVGLELFVIVFRSEIWILVVVTFILTAAVWYVTNLIKKNDTIIITSFSGILLKVFDILLHGSTNRMPNLSILKLLIMCYIVYSIHIQTAYLSNLFRVLTTPQHPRGIENIRQLADSNLPIIAFDINIKNAINDRINGSLEIHRTIMNNLYRISPHLDHEMNEDEVDLRIEEPLRYFIEDSIDSTLWYRFDVPNHVYVIDTLNEIIDGLTESGLYDKEAKDVQHEDNNNKRKFRFETDVTALSLNDVWPMFLIFGFGLAVSFAVFLAEILIHRFKKNII